MSNQANSKPNIVLILADDLGYRDLGCYGSTAIQTPNLDQLASEGIRFTQSYSGCPVCAPSRSVLMTGNHAGHTSVRGNSGGIPLQGSDVTLAALLNSAGYTCGGFGKWGLGDIGTTGVPERHGFNTFFGYYHQVHAHTYYPSYLWRNSEKIELPGNNDGDAGKIYSHYRIFEETCNFIRKNSNQPFFCYAPWTLPHGRYTIPEEDPVWKVYQDKQWSNSAKVAAAMISLFDRHVGQLLQLLQALDLDDNTIIMVSSDHGAGFRFEGELDSCQPLRGHKRTMYEGGIRVPTIVRWNNQIPQNQVSDHPWYFPDIMPTLLDLADLPVPKGLDGISITPTLKNRGEQKKHDHLYWALPLYDFGKREFKPEGLMEAVRKDNWKAVRPLTNAPIELYNLSHDISEEHNVADQWPNIIGQMNSLLRQARTAGHPQIEPKMPEGKRYQ